MLLGIYGEEVSSSKELERSPDPVGYVVDVTPQADVYAITETEAPAFVPSRSQGKISCIDTKLQ